MKERGQRIVWRCLGDGREREGLWDEGRRCEMRGWCSEGAGEGGRGLGDDDDRGLEPLRTYRGVRCTPDGVPGGSACL